MDLFLEEANNLLDDSRKLPDDRLDDLFSDFRRAMHNCRLVFGGHAFRKWPLGHEGRNPINRPLFETWAVVLADSAADDLSARRDAIVDAARHAMASDLEYVGAISTATGNLRNVRLRFDVARRASQAGK